MEGRSYLIGRIRRYTYPQMGASGSHASSLSLSRTFFFMLAGLPGKSWEGGGTSYWRERPCSVDVQGYDSAGDHMLLLVHGASYREGGKMSRYAENRALRSPASNRRYTAE